MSGPEVPKPMQGADRLGHDDDSDAAVLGIDRGQGTWEGAYTFLQESWLQQDVTIKNLDRGNTAPARIVGTLTRGESFNYVEVLPDGSKKDMSKLGTITEITPGNGKVVRVRMSTGALYEVTQRL